MSTMRGWPSSRKPEDQIAQHATIEPTGAEQYGLSVNARVFVYQVGVDAAETGSTVSSIVATGHAAQIGDVIWFTSGALDDREVRVISVSTNEIVLADEMPAAPGNGDTFAIMRPRSPQIDVNGNLTTTPGPVQFVLNSVDTEVEQDTVTPANSRPLPVKVFRDNGTDDWADDVETLLTSIDGKDFATQTTLAAVLADTADIEIATEAVNTNLGAQADASASSDTGTFSLISLFKRLLEKFTTLNAVNFATETTLASVDVSNAAIETSVALIDNAIQTQGNPAGNDFMQIGGVASGNAHRWQVNASGHGQVEVAAALPAGTNNIGDVDVATLPVTYNAGNSDASTQRVVIATDQAAVATKAPRNTTGSIVNDSLTGTTPQTETAPANAVGFILFADDDNDDSIRFAIGSAASTTVGCRLAPGRDSGFIPSAANVSLCAIAGTGTAAYALQWIVES